VDDVKSRNIANPDDCTKVFTGSYAYNMLQLLKTNKSVASGLTNSKLQRRIHKSYRSVCDAVIVDGDGW